MAKLTTESHPAEINRFRTGKAYTIAQAARLAKTTPATVRRWLVGYEAPGHQMAPVFGDGRRLEAEGPLLISFLELVEIVVVARFRAAGPHQTPVKLERLRRALAFARARFGLPYPFASLKLLRFGGHVLHEFEEREPGPGALALDMNGQWVLPGIVRGILEQFEFRDEFASRWYPAGRDVPIVIDPRIGGGRPTVLGSGVTVDVIRKRFEAGERISEIAEDFDLKPSEVEEALRYAAAA